MNQDQFNELTEKLLNACKDALGMKAGEYAREGDRLHNFYAAARKRNKHPLDSLLSMQVKHRVSIDDICDDIINHKKFPTDEMMLEKFKDDINYNLLAFALIHELREKARKEVFAAGPMQSPTKTDSAKDTAVFSDDGHKVRWKGGVYRPVNDKNDGCKGCCFDSDYKACKLFREVIPLNMLCESGVVWLKVV